MRRTRFERTRSVERKTRVVRVKCCIIEAPIETITSGRDEHTVYGYNDGKNQILKRNTH
jgi:hypothetical protein